MRETTVGKTLGSIYKLSIRNNWTISAISSTLAWVSEEVAPPGLRFPATHEAALKLLAPYVLASHRLIACPSDCTLFDAAAAEQQCSTCGLNAVDENGKRGRYFYFCPLQSLLQNVFADPHKGCID
jgi:hypothetical protein